MPDRRDEQRMRGAEALVVLDIAPARHGAEMHAPIVDGDAAQIRDAAEVDENARRREPEGKHR
jgi:hypothetical protein